MAATVLAMANWRPSTPVVMRNIDGSISGEASQKAITGARGTPLASKGRDDGNDAA